MKRHIVLSFTMLAVLSVLSGLAVSAHGEDAEATEEASTAVLETDLARASYAVGMQLGAQLKQSELKFDTKALYEGIEDMLTGKKPALNEQEMMAAMQSLQ